MIEKLPGAGELSILAEIIGVWMKELSADGCAYKDVSKGSTQGRQGRKGETP